MTIDAFERAAEHPIMGIGPYAIPHPYAEGAITVSVIIDGAPVELAETDFTVTPLASDSEGNVYLSTAAAAAHAGRALWIDRATPALQIWEARSGEREVGMEAQLDRLTMAAQELQTRSEGTVRVRGTLAPVIPSPGRALVWGDGTVEAGPTADEIASAQAHAETAIAAALAAPGFATRAAFIVENQATEGLGLTDGKIKIAGGFEYRRKSGSTAIADLPGWVPNGKIFPEHFGAAGDGAADDTAAIQAAFSYAIPTRTVTLCEGASYRCGQISAADGVNFCGSDCDVFITSASWLLFSEGIASASSRVERVRIRPTLAPTVGSVGIGFVSAALSSRRGIEIVDVTFHGADGASISAYGFEKFIVLTDASYPRIEDLRIDGCYNPQISPVGQFVSTGIALEGQTVGAVINHCRLGSLHTALSAGTTQQEGLQIIASEAVGCRDGFKCRSSTFGGPGVWFVDTHANCSRVSFDVANRIDVSLTGCTAYRSNVLFEEPYIGFDFEGTIGVRFANCLQSNSIVTGSTQCIAFRFLNSVAVVGATSEARNSRSGFILQGGCSDITLDAVSMSATSGYSQEAFATTATDADVTLGPHSLTSTWATPYVIAQQKDSIVINLGRAKYVRSAAVTYSSATTQTLTVGASPQHWRINLATGAAAYDAAVELSTTGAQLGDFFDFYINLPSAADRRVIFKNGVGGTVLATMFTAASKRYGARFVFDGTAWVAAWINESVFI